LKLKFSRNSFPDEDFRPVQRVDETLFDSVFEVVVTAPQRPPAPWLPRRLNALFYELQRVPPKSDPVEIADLIWALWIRHTNDEAASAMAAAIEAMAAGAFDLARPILDRLISTHPDWSEAWNKRATLYYSMKRDEDSLQDIRRALEVEPRHFGAILGFAQISLRQRRVQEAKAAFEVARRIHPHIEGIDSIIVDLGASMRHKH
jgi:tetratricopeptide (TPR) repeat protein